MHLPTSNLAKNSIFFHQFDENDNLIVFLQLFSSSKTHMASFQCQKKENESNSEEGNYFLTGTIRPEFSDQKEVLCDIALSLCVAYSEGCCTANLNIIPEQYLGNA